MHKQVHRVMDFKWKRRVMYPILRLLPSRQRGQLKGMRFNRSRKLQILKKNSLSYYRQWGGIHLFMCFLNQYLGWRH